MSISVTLDVTEGQDFDETMHSFDQWLNYYLQLALERNGQEVAFRARQYAPVRTGRLMQNIYAQAVATLAVKVFCNVPYAIFQELGTRFIEPRLFLTRALQESVPNLFSLLQLAIQQAAVDAKQK